MIRPMRPEEALACVRLIRESFNTVAQEFGFTPENAPRFTAFAITAERLEAQRQDPRRVMFVCERQGEILGYASLLAGDGEGCELNNLCVSPAHRHKGIGGRLLEHAFSQAQRLGGSRIEIGIVEENQRLRRWYEGYGFTHIGTKKFDFFPFTCGYMEKLL